MSSPSTRCRLARWALAGATTVLAACGGGSAPRPQAAPEATGEASATADSRSCDEGGPCSPGTVVGWWRVTLTKKADGSVDVIDHERYRADAGAPVLTSSAPTHAILAYDDAGSLLSSTPLAFPERLIVENFETLTRQERALDNAVTVAVLRAPETTTRIVVVDREGSEVGRIDGEALAQGLREPSDRVPPPLSSSRGNWLAQSSDAIAGHQNCPHVEVLETIPTNPGLKAAIGELFTGPTQAAPMSSLQREQIYAALEHLSPLQCSALRAVGFVDASEGSALGWQTSVSGGLVFLNAKFFSDQLLSNGNPKTSGARFRAEMQRTVVHEATHAVQELLDAGDRELDLQVAWPPSVRSTAKEVLDAHLFPKGSFLDEWKRTHRSFVALDLAAEPWSAAQKHLEPSPETGEILAKNGFMTRYGATAYHDDIAELASIVQTLPLYAQFPASEQRDYVCKALQNMEEEWVPSRYSAAFVKLGFLKTLGVIEQEHYDQCVGKAKLPDYGPGIHSIGKDGQKRSYDEDIRQAVQFVARKGQPKRGRYQLIADGKMSFGGEETDGQFRMEVDTGPKATDQPPIPRGIYQVKGGWIGQRTRIKGETAGHWGRWQIDLGWIVISEASLDGMRGFIEVRKASRPTAFMAKVNNLPDRIFFDIPRQR